MYVIWKQKLCFIRHFTWFWSCIRRATSFLPTTSGWMPLFLSSRSLCSFALCLSLCAFAFHCCLSSCVPSVLLLCAFRAVLLRSTVACLLVPSVLLLCAFFLTVVFLFPLFFCSLCFCVHCCFDRMGCSALSHTLQPRCVWERERTRERQREIDREREKERERQRER